MLATYGPAGQRRQVMSMSAIRKALSGLDGAGREAELIIERAGAHFFKLKRLERPALGGQDHPSPEWRVAE